MSLFSVSTLRTSTPVRASSHLLGTQMATSLLRLPIFPENKPVPYKVYMSSQSGMNDGMDSLISGLAGMHLKKNDKNYFDVTSKRLSKEYVNIFDVTPRDGLQSELPLSPELRAYLSSHLMEAGIQDIESAAFVSPKNVPSMAKPDEVLNLINKAECARSRIWVLVPNIKGLEGALKCRDKIHGISVITSASDRFQLANTGATVQKSLEVIKPVVQRALEEGLNVRGYISCAFGYGEEEISHERFLNIAENVLELGCRNIVVCDTTGQGQASDIYKGLECFVKKLGASQLAAHLHATEADTRDKLDACLEAGIRIIDTSIEGLGGCPAARKKLGKSAVKGNLNTLLVAKRLHQLGYVTNVIENKLQNIGVVLGAAMVDAVDKSTSSVSVDLKDSAA